MIHVEHLQKTFQTDGNAVHAIEDISLTIDRGTFVAVMGPSGSGKSTLLYLLGLLDHPTSGLYRFQDQEMTTISPREQGRRRREKMGFIFQDFNLLPRLSALQNVELPLIYRGNRPGERRKRAQEALESVQLGHRIHHRPNELSGGEKQRVAIARALVVRPEVIFADEPTGNLDSKTGQEIIGMLREIHVRSQATVVMITHDANNAMVAQRIIRLRDGKIDGDSQ
jgi:putative ABC transport system ATP-binding protein